MNARERAGLFIDQHCATMDYDRREKAFYAVWNLLDEVIKFAIAEEREACAKLVKRVLDERTFSGSTESRTGSIVADAIRARSEGEK